MPGASEKYIRFAVSLAFAGLTVFLGYFARRTDFLPFIAAYGIFFGLYVWLLFLRKKSTATDFRWYAWLGVGLRVILLFSIPHFSDDFYRFLWDGRLTAAGYHPFIHTPAYFIANHIEIAGITPELFSKLNSPAYYTVYPPLCQAVFALAAVVSPTGEWAGVLVMKLLLLACEAGTIFQLAVAGSNNPWRYPRDGGRMAVLYALNPLLILEIVGNCHFEGLMIFCLVAGVRALEQNRARVAAVFWALATAAKLLPLMFLPILFRYLGREKRIGFLSLFALLSLVLFAPLLGVLPNIASSLDLYFRQFQFNASVYYLLRAFGFLLKGYDVGETLGPMLGLATVAGVVMIARKVSTAPGHSPEGMAAIAPGAEVKVAGIAASGLGLTDALLLALMLQLSLSAAVHPWYATVPLALGIMAGRRFPVWWSGLVALSYSHYSGGGFQENYWLIALEYSALWGLILLEFRELRVARRILSVFTPSRFRPRNNPPGS